MKKKQSKISFTLKIAIENDEGLDQFSRLVFALYNNGFQPTALRLLDMLIIAADKRGVEVPPEVRAFAEHRVPIQ
jgi:hypothetical protein